MPSQRKTASYGPVLLAYAALAGMSAAGLRRRGRRVAVPAPTDVVLLGLATFKLSRIVTKEKVLEPVREPFVESVSPGSGSEVNSRPAGTGVRRAVGELLTCPFCVSLWIATVLTVAFAVVPRAARLVASALAAVVIADTSQYAYSGLRRVAEPGVGHAPTIDDRLPRRDLPWPRPIRKTSSASS